jgi:hypothetical protein
MKCTEIIEMRIYCDSCVCVYGSVEGTGRNLLAATIPSWGFLTKCYTQIIKYLGFMYTVIL